jgi:ubiquinone/menaquinone biosynthesis C-methylase UbiE
VLNPVDYDGHQSSVYAKGRALPAEVTAAWMSAFSRHSPPGRPLSVLDLGSGTGRFTPALAETFGGPVYGVEPSSGMRQAALADAAHPAVTYLEGSACAIPLPDASVDVVLLFLVWQHVPDREAAAGEIRRVLRPGGRMLFRSTFGDRLPEGSWLGYFPSAAAVEAAMFPALAQVEAEFAGAGLRQVALDVVRVQTVESFTAYVERLRLRAISTFEYLSEEEIEQGFARMDADVAAGTPAFRLAEDGDLLVLELPAAGGPRRDHEPDGDARPQWLAVVGRSPWCLRRWRPRVDLRLGAGLRPVGQQAAIGGGARRRRVSRYGLRQVTVVQHLRHYGRHDDAALEPAGRDEQRNHHRQADQREQPGHQEFLKASAVGVLLQRDEPERLLHVRQVHAGPGEEGQAGQPGGERRDPWDHHEQPEQQADAEQRPAALEDRVVVEQRAAATWHARGHRDPGRGHPHVTP